MALRLRHLSAVAALCAVAAGAWWWLAPPAAEDELFADGEAGAQAGPRADAPAPARVEGERIIVPSGQEITLQDVVTGVPGPDGLTARFRFLAPAIARQGGSVDFEAASRDMEALCTGYALPRISEGGAPASQIVISLSDIAVPFGEAAPEATQYFEAYAIRDGACIWEVF